MRTIYDSLDLLPYQSAFAANESRFKIGLWARQTGKDHTATAEAVIDCLRNPGATWIILAASERQALESLSKAKDWADILKFNIEDYIESSDPVPPAHRLSLPGLSPARASRLTCAEITWSNRSRLLALPANPQTIRGYSANLILTEFAFHENPDEIWRAIYPSISNPLRGGVKKLRIISTPNGLRNKFADLWLNTPSAMPGAGAPHGVPSPRAREGGTPPRAARHLISAPYFKSKITIHDAIAFGLPLDAAELKAGLNDPDAWSQEYLCDFMDASTVMFPYDLIAPCESPGATELLPGGAAALSAAGLLFAGIDFARKKDLTVCWILERIPHQGGAGAPPGALLLTREVLTLKNTSTPDQIEILRPRLKHCRKICLDYTGAGVGLGDYLVKEFGACASPRLPSHPALRKVELCHFTNALKAELFPRLRAAFEQRALRIPVSREIREDLHAIQRVVTLSGQISYRAPRGPEGHCDRAVALALAFRAASHAPCSFPARAIFLRGRAADRRWTRGSLQALRARDSRRF